MEHYKSLFIATGAFAALMLTAAHVRHPQDSVLTSSAHAASAQVVQVKPAAKIAGAAPVPVSQRGGQVATLFTSLPLSTIPLRFEAPRPQADGKQQALRSPARAPSSNRAVTQAPSKPIAQRVFESLAALAPARATTRLDPLSGLLRGLIDDRTS